MRVRKLDTRLGRDIKEFVSFPFELYRHSPRWVPPLISGVRTELNREKHPFYQHSTADFFVAESEGDILGRISVMSNRNYNQHHGSKVAFFGHLELVEDREVAHTLFGAAFNWARDQGLEKIMGPRGLTGSDGGGVLVEGFEYQPAIGAAYTLPYYDALIMDSGFQSGIQPRTTVFGRKHNVVKEVAVRSRHGLSPVI